MLLVLFMCVCIEVVFCRYFFAAAWCSNGSEFSIIIMVRLQTLSTTICIILGGKLKEATTEYKSHAHHGGTCDPSCFIWYNLVAKQQSTPFT